MGKLFKIGHFANSPDKKYYSDSIRGLHLLCISCLLIFFFLSANTALFGQCPGKRIIGHRGGSTYYYPENTLLSIEQAYIEGADMVETDINMTKDSVMILIHDDYLDRTTSGHGDVIQHTLSEIQSLDAGSWKGPKFTGLKVPTFYDALRLAKKYHGNIFLDIKYWEPDILTRDISLSGIQEEQVFITITSLNNAIDFHKLLPKSPLVYAGFLPPQINDTAFYKSLADKGTKVIEVPFSTILETKGRKLTDLMNTLKYLGLELWTFTLNDNGFIHEASDLGLNGIETDRPAEALSILCSDSHGGYFPEKRITGAWDFNKKDLSATIGSKMVFKTKKEEHESDQDPKIEFGTTQGFGIPDIDGKAVNIVKIPALKHDQSLTFYSNIAPQGNPGETYCDQNYTILMDILKPASVQPYISLFQSSYSNYDDGDIFIKTVNNSIGIFSQYNGTFKDSTWIRLAFAFDLVQNKLFSYINGIYVGFSLLNGDLNGRFCINNNWAIQGSNFFSDESNETGTLYVSSLQIRDYFMKADEIASLGGVTDTKIPTSVAINPNDCPVILESPKNLTLQENGTATFYTTAGDTVNYRWQVNEGSGWQDLSGISYERTNYNTVIVKNVTPSMNQYQFRCIVSNDCQEVSNYATLIVTSIPTGINDLLVSEELVVYPNPTKGQIYFRFGTEFSEEHSIELLSLNGSVLSRRITCETEYEMDISNLPDGMYLIRISGNNNLIVKKIILKH